MTLPIRNILPEEISKIEFEIQGHETYKLDLVQNRCFESLKDERECLKQSITVCLLTERYRYLIYPHFYGLQTRDLIGKPINYIIPVLKKRITQAIQYNFSDRVQSISNINFEVLENDVLICSFICKSVYGDVSITDLEISPSHVIDTSDVIFKYTIMSPESAGGTVVLSQRKAYVGEIITFEISPNFYYTIDSVSVTADGQTITVTPTANENEYNFIMPNSDVVININYINGVYINETNFPDSIFRNFVKSNYDTNNENILYFTVANNVTDLRVRNMNITSVKGIEYFPKLQTFYCDRNQLSALDVTQNTNLTHLYCYSNRLTALDVTQNTNLTQLNCYSNQLTALDVTQNTNLTQLHCYSNNVGELNLSVHNKLQRLRTWNCNLPILDLSACTSIRSDDT